MARFAPIPFPVIDPATGMAASGAKIYTYDNGTTSNKATYPTKADAEAATNANTNPVLTNAAGMPVTDIWLLTDAPYTITVKTSDDATTIFSSDDITGVFDNRFDDGDSLDDSNDNELLKFSETASAVNEVTLANAATGNGPTISATGSDTNIDLIFSAKGTGSVTLSGNLAINDANGNESLTTTSTASAVNEIDIANAATGTDPVISATGDDTNIGLTLTPKGDGTAKVVSEDSRTNSVRELLSLQATTDGTPAAGIGVGMTFIAETADEAPSTFGSIEVAASDVTGGSEDTYLDIGLRVAGNTNEAKYRFQSTSTDSKVIFTHAATADRTVTFPDADLDLSSGATQSEQEAGTATSFVTPAVQQFHQSAAKAWVRFAGSDGTISGSYNVSSVTDVATGRQTVNWDTDFSNTNYAVIATLETANGANTAHTVKILSTTIAVGSVGTLSEADGVDFDSTSISVVAFGDQ